MMLMAQAMQHTLQLMGVNTQRKVSQIYLAQHASDYLQEAAKLIGQRGRAV